MADIDVVIIDPGGYSSNQSLDDQLGLQALVTLLVPRLGLPEELSYYLIPKVTGRAMKFTDTLASIGTTPGAQIELRPARDDVFARILDELYKKAEKYVVDKLWNLAKKQLDQLFRIEPNHPDPQGLRQQVKVHFLQVKLVVGVIIIVIFVVTYSYNRKPTEPSKPTLGTGDIHARLYWSGPNDLDLWVTDPLGETILHSHKVSRSLGKLDVDSNAGCQRTRDEPVENIFWKRGGAPAGRYTVVVNYYKHCGGEAETSYRVEMKMGQVNRVITGTINRGQQQEVITFDY